MKATAAIHDARSSIRSNGGHAVWRSHQCPRRVCSRSIHRRAVPGNQIPASRLASVSQSLLNHYVPLPNFGNGVDTNGNYRVQALTPASINGYDARIDQYQLDTTTLRRWSWKNVDTTAPNQLLPSEQDHETNRNLTLSYNYTIRRLC